MKILLLSLLLLLAVSVSHGRPSISEPRLIELLTSTKLIETEADLIETQADLLDKQLLSINYPDCRSWHLGVETSNIINFKTVPANCKDYVEDYLITSQQYRHDSKTVCKEAYFYAKGLALKNDTVNVWIFDLDDTLLSNVPFYAYYGYGTQKHPPEKFKTWLELGQAPNLPETLHLYQNLIDIGIEPVLLTERYEELAEVTLKNLKAAGFTYWKHVLFKPNDSNAKIATFKSQERKKLSKSGYTIIGNIGDQWADLAKDSPGRRTFKLPNPIYYKT